MLSVILYCISGFILLAICAKLFSYFTSGSYKVNAKDVQGKTIVITGATSGIGLETIRELAKHGAQIKMLCRNVSKAIQTVNDLTDDGEHKLDLHVIECDTSNLNSVRNAAEKVLKECPKIDVLINNAGIGGEKNYRKSDDGFEMTMAANHFGHFLLTELLMDRMKCSAPSRIINVSSLGHKWASQKYSNYSADTLNMNETNYNGLKAYINSKLVQVHVTRVWARLLHGTGVSVNVLHPGAVQTNIIPSKQILLKLVFYLFKTAAEGAQTSLFLAVAPEAQNISGNYFADCAPSSTTLLGLDEQIAQQVYDKSVQLCQLNRKKLQ